MNVKLCDQCLSGNVLKLATYTYRIGSKHGMGCTAHLCNQHNKAVKGKTMEEVNEIVMSGGLGFSRRFDEARREAV